VVRSVLLSLLAFVLWALFGVGLGALVRGQVAAVVLAIASYAGGYAVVELVFHALYNLTHQGWMLAAPVIAPAVASSVMITPGQSFPHAPPQWEGAAVMAGYALVLSVAGTAQTLRRDVPAGTA